MSAHGAEFEQALEQAAQAAVAHAGGLCRGDDRVVRQKPVDDDVRASGAKTGRHGDQAVRPAPDVGRQVDGPQRRTRLRGEQTLCTLTRSTSMLAATTAEGRAARPGTICAGSFATEQRHGVRQPSRCSCVREPASNRAWKVAPVCGRKGADRAFRPPSRSPQAAEALRPVRPPSRHRERDPEHRACRRARLRPAVPPLAVWPAGAEPRACGRPGRHRRRAA